jgi:hypothetical protein
MKYKSDKLLNGIIAGSIASIAKDLLTIIPELILKLHPSYWDYSNYWIFVSERKKLPNLLISIFAEICFGAFLATAYSYLKDYMQTRYIIFRGILYGFSIWFILRGIITLFKIRDLVPTEPTIVIINIIIGGIYGLVISYILKWLESKNN